MKIFGIESNIGEIFGSANAEFFSTLTRGLQRIDKGAENLDRAIELEHDETFPKTDAHEVGGTAVQSFIHSDEVGPQETPAVAYEPEVLAPSVDEARRNLDTVLNEIYSPLPADDDNFTLAA